MEVIKRAVAPLLFSDWRSSISLPCLQRVRFLAHDPNRRQELAAYTRDDLQCTLPELGQITLIMTNGDREQTCLWRRIVNTCHPLKNSNLCGRQIRYLVESSNHGTIGALSFSSPAWRLAARDKWISWNDSSRPVQLDRIINNSRFLILPQVLAMACRQVVPDWKSMYGLDAVLLETFVDPRSYRGTSYRAAN